MIHSDTDTLKRHNTPDTGTGEYAMPSVSRTRLYAYYVLLVFVFYVWYQVTINLLLTGRAFDFNGRGEAAPRLSDCLHGFHCQTGCRAFPHPCRH